MMKRLIPVFISVSMVLAENGEATEPAANSGGGFNMGFMLLAMIGVWFFLLRPEMKKQKEKEKKATEMRDNLSKGDKVITAGGIYGTVKKVDGEKVVISVSKTSELTVLKTSIGTYEEALNEELGKASE